MLEFSLVLFRLNYQEVVTNGPGMGIFRIDGQDGLQFLQGSIDLTHSLKFPGFLQSIQNQCKLFFGIPIRQDLFAKPGLGFLHQISCPLGGLQC